MREPPVTQTRWAFMGLAMTMAAGVLVFWLFDALPFQDLPAHAGTLAIRQRYAGSAFDERYFKLGSSLGPYSVFLWGGALLERIVGPLRAMRVLATLPVLATPLALMFARRRLHGDRSLWAGFVGVALSFGFMTLLGLTSYLLSLSLLLFAFTVWLELIVDLGDERKARKRELAFAGLGLVVGLGHGFALAVLGLLALATSLAGSKAERTARLLRLRALLPALAPMGWSFFRGGPPEGSSAPFVLVASADYQTAVDKLSLLLTPTLMTRTGLDLGVGVVLWVTLGFAVVATARQAGASGTPKEPELAERRSRAHARALGVALASVVVSFFALPHAFRWFGFIDGRLVPVILYVVILCVRRPALGRRLNRWLDVLAPGAAALVTSIALAASSRFQAEARGYREVFGEVPPRASLLNLPLDPDSRVFTAHPFVHYDKLIALDRPVLLSDVWPDRGTTLYPTPNNPELRLPDTYNSANLRRIDWAAYDLRDWSYVLVRTRPEASPPSTPNELELVRHVGGWWLYRTPGRLY